MKNDIPAFPMPITEGGRYCQLGMTIRDYFAAKAMPTLMTIMPDQLGRIVTRAEFALEAYKYADAMLAERAK